MKFIAKIKKIIKLFIPYGIVIYREKVKRINDPKIEVFYIIRGHRPLGGLFSNFNYVLGHIIYAIKNGYLPVIDMQNYKTFYKEELPINGTKNAWEYYFQQPINNNLDQAYNANDVILSPIKWPKKHLPFFFETKEQIEYFNKYITEYMKFNETTIKAIENAKIKYFNYKKNILGVLYRGTDYIEIKPKDHSIIAPIDDYIKKIHECLKEWKMDYVYLETEDMRAVEIFKNEFQEKLIITDSKRVENYNPEMGWVPTINFGRENDNYLKGLEYIIDTMLLASCDSIIAPKVNGTMAALAFNNNSYKYKYIFDLGKY